MPHSPIDSAPMDQGRLYYLDNLRTLGVMLVVLHHTAITYGAAGSWYYREVTQASLSAVVLTLLAATNQAFVLGLLFFIAGFFTPRSLDRKGAARYLRDRVIRLGIPLLAYAFVLGPILEYLLYCRETTTLLGYYRSEVFTLKSIGFGPLWFAEALLIFSAGYVLWWRLFSRRRDPATRSFPSIRAMLVTAVGTGLAAFALRLVWPCGANVLQMQLGFFASYVVLFVVGTQAQQAAWLEHLPSRTVTCWAWLAAIAIAALPVIFVLGGGLSGELAPFVGGMTPQALAVALWEPFVAFGVILSLLRWFQLRLNRSGSVQRALAESSFTAYIIHPLVLVGASQLARSWTGPPAAKFVAVGLLGIMACFAVSYLITRIPGVRRVL